MNEIVAHAGEIWAAGGWAMIALALNALLLFGIGIHAWLRFRTRGLFAVPESRWRRWVESEGERRGRVGELIEFVMGASSIDDMSTRFGELHAAEIAPFTRDLRFMRRAVSTAPLLGLLGTVTGMLTTFYALSTGSGGEKTMGLVAGGISEALITTETGLVIALPGLVFQYYLSRARDRYETFMARLETVCAQHLYRQLRAQRAAAGGTR